ncbi:uncharacterized protein LOC124175593 [Neodiprion fabricii]|uniref:uncharacterized protein LOC124175593 n=1 Tax=Neodiprion fabricii TaxID=2872261 RepID=UPI001ED8D567|nr:uncharacterized protein LOC124175593 [Neodiprion fabricii]
MGNLPRSRVTPARPFQFTVVDYAGPIALKTSPGRGHKTTKAFFVIFVCMVTKAVHLDIASDYSTQAFTAALKRFISRRGLCTELYSDRGTNFVGANAELQKLIRAATSEHNSFTKELAQLGITWRFNPPAAPHFGGLWEAAVKSTKFHLRRVIGDASLTYEEMSTVLSQIEACLNSRPLSALTDDPDDVSALTPGHFLIGAPLNALPESTLADTPTSRLSRWQQLTQMRDHFWTRWPREYIQSLIPRNKWLQAKDDMKKGRLCLIRNEITPPSKWPLGRIIETLPGNDGLIRVAVIKTATTTLTRPINKTVLLPIAAEE